MFKNSKEDSYEERLKKIDQGKSYLKTNGFFCSKSNIFEDIQIFIHKMKF